MKAMAIMGVIIIALAGSLKHQIGKAHEASLLADTWKQAAQSQNDLRIAEAANRQAADNELVANNTAHKLTEKELKDELDDLRQKDKDWRDLPVPADTAASLRDYAGAGSNGVQTPGGHSNSDDDANTGTSIANSPD